MVRVIEALCDVCFAQDIRREGKTESIAINGGPTVLLDLCDEDRAKFIQPLLDLITNHGVTEDGRSVKPSATRTPRGVGDVECAICQEKMASQTTLSGHMKRKHPDEYPAYMEARGMHAAKCRVKGCGQVFYGPQALSMHTFRSHPS